MEAVRSVWTQEAEGAGGKVWGVAIGLLRASNVVEPNGALNLFGALAAIVGSVIVLGTAISWGVWLVGRVVSHLTAPKLSSLGKWAVVTGASSGIGRATAMECARRGLAVCLISSSHDRLVAVAEEIQDKFGVDTQVIAEDLSNLDERTMAGLRAGFVALDQDGGIALLVNNVGASYPTALYYDELSWEDVDRILALNCRTGALLTRAVIGMMSARGKGAIINVSSGHGRIPVGTPLYSLYAGSKAFVETFSKSLSAEYGPKGLRIQAQSPYYVISPLSKFKDKHESLTIIKPEAYARASLDALALPDAALVPYWSHDVQDAVLRYLPAFIAAPLVMSSHTNIRNAFLRRQARQAKEAEGEALPSAARSASPAATRRRKK